MSEIKLNVVMNGTEVATIDGQYAQNINLFPAIQGSVTALSDTKYYKLGSVPFGSNATDAVNISQLNALSTSMTSNMGTMQTAINNQATALSTLSSQVSSMNSSMYVAGDIKTSVLTDDHGKWLVCNGRAISRSTYASLFSALGTAFGTGDGSTTFNLPDARARSPLYVGQGLTAEGGGNGTQRLLGASGGVEAHALTIAEMPNHSHTFTNQTIANDTSISLLGTGNRVTASPTANTSSVGGGAAHSIMHPYLVVGSLFIYTG